MHIRTTLRAVLRSVAAAVVAVAATLALTGTAHATDPGLWGPGDLIEFPASEPFDPQTGTVDANGLTITMNGGSSTHRWNNSVTVANAAAGGAHRIG